MKIYAAAPWAHRGDMPEIAAAFEAAGHTITWKWWDTPDIKEGSDMDHELEAQARNDVRGVREADIFILINSAKSEGKAVETGIAFERKIPIIAVGKRGSCSMNVFHYLTPEVGWVDTIEEAIKCLSVMTQVR